MDVAAMCGLESVDLGSVDNASILSLLECPVCLDHITPPVKQCVKGHLVCIDCFPRLHHCPTCRSPMCDERNLAMEQVSRLLRYPCRYHPMGCKDAFPLAKKAAHERSCQFLQLKCPFHGQCAFNGSLADVVPHLASEHSVNPVLVQPAGTFFYRAKNFYRRNIWALIFLWDGNLFRFILKHVTPSQVGRTENCNLLVAHVQYIGPESMASRYSYQISLFDTYQKEIRHKFEGLVTSTLKPLETHCNKEDIFVTTFNQARIYTDPWSNLNFIIRMKKLLHDHDDLLHETLDASSLQAMPSSSLVSQPDPASDPQRTATTSSTGRGASSSATESSGSLAL